MSKTLSQTKLESRIRNHINTLLSNLVINNKPIENLRNSQELIIQKASEALSSNKHLLVRAPTGCGKTLAYSLIADFIIREQDGRVIVLCPTKNLQEQILQTFVALGQNPTVLYGSTEYHCPLRAEILSSNPYEFVPVITLLCKLHESCKFREANKCDYFLAQEMAKNSKLVITNYHKFLENWDSIIGQNKVDLLILDEAHNFEAIAEESQRVEISSKLLEDLLVEFETQFVKNYDLQGEEIKISKITGSKIEKMNIMKVKGSFMAIIKKIKKLFEWRDETEFKPEELFDLANECRNLANELTSFAIAEIERVYHPEDMPFLKLREDLLKFQRAVRQFGLNTRFIGKKSGKIFNWTDFKIIGEPNIRELIKNILNRATKLQFHVSATLGKLSFYARRVGMGERYVECKIDEYPFDINRRRLIYISDSPSMKKYGNFHHRMEKANEILKKILLSWPGNTMVYFRSREEAEVVYNFLREDEMLKPRLFYRGYFKTGGERRRFIEKFSMKKGGILLGFGRMDQGIDLPDDRLTMVVMYSIPFVKRTFQMEKDYDYFLKTSGNSIRAYQMVDLDVAARRISQLIGRLIRSESDFGVGIVIDQRFFRFYRWMRGADMLPEDMHFESMPSHKACLLLEKFWNEMKGMSYEEYVDLKVEDVTLEDFL